MISVMRVSSTSWRSGPRARRYSSSATRGRRAGGSMGWTSAVSVGLDVLSAYWSVKMTSVSDLTGSLDAYIEQNTDRWLDELARLCAVPSVSARHEGIDECAAVVADLLRARGFEVEVSPTAGHPIVYAAA